MITSLGSYVEDVPGYLSRGNFSFERSDCEEWVANERFNNSVYATCDTVDDISPGMTVLEGSVPNRCYLALTQILTHRDEHRVQDSILLGSVNYKVAFTQTFSDGNFTYKPEDVIQSSLSGWMNYGYKYAPFIFPILPSKELLDRTKFANVIYLATLSLTKITAFPPTLWIRSKTSEKNYSPSPISEQTAMASTIYPSVCSMTCLLCPNVVPPGQVWTQIRRRTLFPGIRVPIAINIRRTACLVSSFSYEHVRSCGTIPN